MGPLQYYFLHDLANTMQGPCWQYWDLTYTVGCLALNIHSLLYGQLAMQPKASSDSSSDVDLNPHVFFLLYTDLDPDSVCGSGSRYPKSDINKMSTKSSKTAWSLKCILLFSFNLFCSRLIKATYFNFLQRQIVIILITKSYMFFVKYSMKGWNWIRLKRIGIL